MFKINENYLKLPGSYLFSTIAKKGSRIYRGKSGQIHHSTGNWGCNTATCAAIIDAFTVRR